MDLYAIKSDILWIKEAMPKYLEPGKKRELIRRWAEDLEELQKLGDYTKPIDTICSTIRTELENMNQRNDLFYVNEVLPFKYKEMKHINKDYLEDLTSSVFLASDSSITPDYTDLNKNLISIISRTIETLHNAKKALSTKESIEPHIPEQEFAEFQVRWKYSIERLDEILDGREKVPPTTMHLMLYLISHYTQSNIYSHYVRFRKEEAELTPKQTGKIIKGHVSKMTALYEPKTIQEAISSGFYGQQCSECGSYRTDKKYNPNIDKFRLFCFACSAWCRLKTERIRVKE